MWRITRPGSEVLLKKNPHYWKRDAQGRALPYLDAIRLSIQQNRTMEMVRFTRGELHLINNVAPDNFEKLAGETPAAVSDIGPGLESELLWFNQAPGAPLPEFKKAWFRSAGVPARGSRGHQSRRSLPGGLSWTRQPGGRTDFSGEPRIGTTPA